jgi:uncharacterized RDD family membrane protein YckC
MNCQNCQKEVMPDSFFCTWCSDFIPATGLGKRANLFARWFAWAIDPLIAVALYALSLAVLLTIWRPLAFVGALLLPGIYFAWFLVLLRQGLTPGKKLLSLQVVDAQTGRIPGFGKMFLREIVGRFVSGVAFGVGYLWAIFDKNAQAWHDKIAGTVVLQRPAKHSPVVMGVLGVAGSGLALLLSVIGVVASLGSWAADHRSDVGAAIAQAGLGAGAPGSPGSQPVAAANPPAAPSLAVRQVTIPPEPPLAAYPASGFPGLSGWFVRSAYAPTTETAQLILLSPSDEWLKVERGTRFVLLFSDSISALALDSVRYVDNDLLGLYMLRLLSGPEFNYTAGWLLPASDSALFKPVAITDASTTGESRWVIANLEWRSLVAGDTVRYHLRRLSDSGRVLFSSTVPDLISRPIIAINDTRTNDLVIGLQEDSLGCTQYRVLRAYRDTAAFVGLPQNICPSR